MFHDDLFVRAGQGYELTTQGQRLLSELETMLPKLDRLLSGTKFDPATEQANFRLAVTDSAASVLTPLVSRAILPKARRVRFEFVAWHKGIFDELTHGSLDMVFVASTVDVPAPLQMQTIHNEEFVCVVDAKSRYKKAMTLGQYLEAEHIIVSIMGGIQVAPDKTLAALGHKRRGVLQVPYHEAAVRCAQGTEFVATVPRRFMEGSCFNPAIRILDPPKEIKGFRYVMTWHPRVNTDAAHAWLRATMREVGAMVEKGRVREAKKKSA